MLTVQMLNLQQMFKLVVCYIANILHILTQRWKETCFLQMSMNSN